MKKIILLLALTASLTAWETGKVVAVIDGDTVLIKKSRANVMKCRLVGIDTFETKVNHRTFKQLELLNDLHYPKRHTVKNVLRFGYIAKEYVSSKILNKTIRYEIFKEDQYGRPLIYIENINYLLIRKGLAVQYPNNLLQQRRKAFLLEASKQANLEQRGIYDRGL